MTKIAGILLVLAFAAGTAYGAGLQRAHLRVTDPTPLTVRGSDFKAHESVRVVYVADEKTAAVRTEATSAGTFTARFAGVHLDVCSVKQLSATGSMGSRAFVKFMPVACPPPAAAP
jgi:hypothetical protein